MNLNKGLLPLADILVTTYYFSLTKTLIIINKELKPLVLNLIYYILFYCKLVMLPGSICSIGDSIPGQAINLGFALER